MIKQCKKCGSKNLYLEPRIKGQDAMTADMVALKCRDCGVWLKWCPKDERKYYYANKQSKDKWQKLKEWLEEEIKENQVLIDPYCKEIEQVFIAGGLARLSEIQKQMQELEGEDE